MFPLFKVSLHFLYFRVHIVHQWVVARIIFYTDVMKMTSADWTNYYERLDKVTGNILDSLESVEQEKILAKVLLIIDNVSHRLQTDPANTHQEYKKNTIF